MRVWALNPHVGGKKIPEDVRLRTTARIHEYRDKKHPDLKSRIHVHYKGKFCYIDAYGQTDPKDDSPSPDFSESPEECMERIRSTSIRLYRLRYFGDEDRWSCAAYAKSYGGYDPELFHVAYVPAFFHSGAEYGTPEDGFETAAAYLLGKLGDLGIAVP